jgi:hypothetical protein
MHATPTQYNGKTFQSSLERQFIVDYLTEKGYRMGELQTLPNKLVKELMTAACIYASLRLAEIESRSKFIRKLHFED